MLEVGDEVFESTSWVSPATKAERKAAVKLAKDITKTHKSNPGGAISG